MIDLEILRHCCGRFLAATAVALLLCGIAAADDNSGITKKPPASDAYAGAAQPDRITGGYLQGIMTDTGKILASPATWDGSDWLKAGMVIGSTSGLYFADTDIRDFAQRNQSTSGHNIATGGNTLGNPLYAMPALGLFYLYGNLNEDPKARRAALLSLESVLVSGAFTLGLKLATQRPRPDSGETSTTWNGPGIKNTDPAFPSAHTQTAFAVAAVLAEEYGGNPYLPPAAYGLAALTGLSRIYDNKHWASDVFFGAAIGYFVGKAVVKYHEPGKSALTIQPLVSQQGFGFMAEYLY